MKENPHLKNMKAYHPGASIEKIKKQYQVECIKLASNENALGTAVKQSDFKENLNQLNLYPDLKSSELTKRIAAHVNVPEDYIGVGNGSDELLYCLALAFLSPKDELISSEMTFSQYEFVTQVVGATYKAVKMKQFTYDLEAILKAITPQTKMIAIANPNNPTGTLLTHDELDDFLKRKPKEVGVILDEAYIEFSDHPLKPNSIELLNQYDNLIILRTFSKAYGLAGLRLGYCMAASHIVNSIMKVQPPFSVNSMAIKAGILALKNKGFVNKTIKNNRFQKNVLQIELEKISDHVIDTQANFICFKTTKPADFVYEEACKKGVIIRPLTSFGLTHYCRVSIGNPSENQIFLKVIKSIL